MENMGPHREAQERCMGEAQCQRGTGVKPQSQLGKLLKKRLKAGPVLPVTGVVMITSTLLQLIVIRGD